ncbi:hypothetical protein SCRM01_170 [Synechococcus phage S-CRM01]|uniref:hypothetical protein n=1 Tax=Synechococcus phage S-CRM01 TaxID=1026955 RepID=UPI000209E3FB|nr:hypothetical protein SCRM01_170 [Synechococcus phage S-CRM01]AEC53116.1 hypothetical protein SCRM01_170 [Synechococcus phage S-CRM01]
MKSKFDRSNVRWFRNTGIARRYDEQEDKWFYYLKSIDGFDEETDYFQILDWGAHFPAEVGNLLFDNY